MPRRTAIEPAPIGVKYPVPALEKGLDIIELLAERSEGLSQAEMARELQRSVGEIFRMLNALVRRGYIVLNPHTDRYVLTLKLFELAHRHAPMNRLVWNALPIMKALTRLIRQSVHVAVLEQGHAVVVAQVDSPDEVCFSVRVGREMDPLETASGRVLLSFMREADRETLLDLAPERSRAALRQRLARIRRTGFERMPSTRIRGVHDLSVPVMGFGGEAVAAMTVPCIETIGIDREATLAHVRDRLLVAAADLSRSLGAMITANAPGPEGDEA